MSPIGRAFIVANLFLAGGFIFFAGSYLQHQNDYRSQYTAEQEALAEAQKEHRTVQDDLRREIAQLTGQNISLDTTSKSQEARIRELDSQIQAKEELLGQLNSSVQALEASANAMATKIESAVDKADGAYASAVDAQKARDEALAELSQAQREIQEKEREIAALSDTRQQQSAELAGLTKKVRDMDTLLAAARLEGFNMNNLVPPMDGTVIDASGRLVSIQVSENPADADGTKFKGSMVAIYDASQNYKGDVTVTDFAHSGDQLVLLGHMFNPIEGKPVTVGDNATTNVR